MDELGLGAAKPLIDLDPTLPAVLADKTAVLASPAAASGSVSEELYAKWKRLEGHEEFLDLQEVRLLSLSLLVPSRWLAPARFRTSWVLRFPRGGASRQRMPAQDV